MSTLRNIDGLLSRMDSLGNDLLLRGSSLSCGVDTDCLLFLCCGPVGLSNAVGIGDKLVSLDASAGRGISISSVRDMWPSDTSFPTVVSVASSILVDPSLLILIDPSLLILIDPSLLILIDPSLLILIDPSLLILVDPSLLILVSSTDIWPSNTSFPTVVSVASSILVDPSLLILLSTAMS